MEFKPGDILYRKYSDNNDLYCVIAITEGPFNMGLNVRFVRMLPNFRGEESTLLTHETLESINNWFIKVDLNNYDIKDKFLQKIKDFLNEYLGKQISHNFILDNLTYIEILAELRKYQKDDIVSEEDNLS
jgi:hypothetical protein